MFTYEKFREVIMEEVQKQLGEGEQLKLIPVQKNNGIALDGLCIQKKDERMMPTIYLNNYYEQYRMNAFDIEGILEDIMNLYHKDDVSTIITEAQMKDFGYISPLLRFKVVNMERNQMLLETIPFIPVLDLAIIFYLELAGDEQGRMTTLVKNELLKYWQVTTDKLKELAFENTKKNQGICLMTMHEVIKSMAAKNLGDDYSEEVIDALLETGHETMQMYVLTNDDGIYGAGGMLYSDVLREFADKIEKDLIILPSSLHEVLIVPDEGGADYAGLKEMVRHINMTEVPEEDILSDKIYRFTRQTNQVEIIDLQ